MIGTPKVLGRVAPDQAAGRILMAVHVCFFFSGAKGLLYQVLWVRILSLVFGHTVFVIPAALDDGDTPGVSMADPSLARCWR